VNVSAVIVTRGDVDLAPCFAPFAAAGITDLVVWNNATAEGDLAVYGRYEAIGSATGDAILVQDDDVVLDVDSVHALTAAYVPGYVVCNMPRRFRDTGSYDDSALVGFGAIFDRDLPARAFGRMLDSGVLPAYDPRTLEEFFNRECDTVFTMLTPRALVDLPYTDREFASAPDRLWRQPEHAAERERMRRLVRQVRDAA
jgi:hypothetical protein